MTDFELDALDGIAEEFVAILGQRFRYLYRITGAIYIGRVIDVDAIVLHVTEIDGAPLDMFRNLHLNVS